MAARRKLKVFAAPFGFFDTIVAVPSRTAALRAWDVRQNLFHEGYAREVDEPELVAAATAHPGQVLRRPIGSNKPFVLDPDSLPDAPPPPARRRKGAGKPKAAGKPKSEPPRKKPPPDRTALTRAEAALRKLEDAYKAETGRLEARRAELDAEIARARKAYKAARRDAKAALEQARAAYRKAGGEDF
jgi:hypothetical protein